MTVQRPLVLIGGEVQQLPTADQVPGWTDEVRPDQFTGTAAAKLAAAIDLVDGGTVVIRTPADTTALPADYTKSAILYLAERAGYWFHYLTSFGRAKVTFKTQHGTHPTDAEAAVHIEMQAKGSGANGSANADYGLSINAHKEGYATGAALKGEIDALVLNVRQDGPANKFSGDPDRSDSVLVLGNIQTLTGGGFIAGAEGTTSILDRTTFATVKSMQWQVGAMDAYNSLGQISSIGFGATANDGALDHGIYFGEIAGSWVNILTTEWGVQINRAGDYRAETTDYADGAWSMVRAGGVNGAATLKQRGTGTFDIRTQEAAAITFSTGGTGRAQFAGSGGAFTPLSNIGINLGALTLRWGEFFGYRLNLGTTAGNGITIRAGAGSPEGVETANVGSKWFRIDGGPGSAEYSKESGTGNTGWVPVVTDISGKQDALVSGTNIKTVNGNSLLGAGNLVIPGGGGSGPSPILSWAI